jgi:hydrogenase maturation factor
LLAAVAPESADAALAALERREISGRMIGEVTVRRSPLLEVV